MNIRQRYEKILASMIELPLFTLLFMLLLLNAD